MAKQFDFTAQNPFDPLVSLPSSSEGLLEQLSEGGLSSLPEAIRLLVNAAMLLERQRHLGAEAYERTPSRQGHANGFKDKSVRTRMGEVTFAVPQLRDNR